MSTKIKILFYLLALGVIDTIIPIPITAIILTYVLFNKPDW